MSPESVIVKRLAEHGQSHLLRFWDELSDEGRRQLSAEIASIDFPLVDGLVSALVPNNGGPNVPAGDVQPIEVIRLPQTDGERMVRGRVAGIGSDALAAGEVGVILVAGGSGSRLGFDGPKGTFPIGPVSQASLFQIHCEKTGVTLPAPRGHDPALRHDQPRKP